MKVVVLQGGPSSEAEISRKSGAQVFKALKQKGFTAVQRELDERVWERLKQDKPDLVFIALHGRPGEDGSVQGMLELLGIPYTGSGITASAIGIDKEKSKAVFRQARIPVPRGFLVSRAELAKMSDQEIASKVSSSAGWPCIVKPCHAGSTIGLSKVSDRRKIRAAILEAVAEDDCAVIEQLLSGTEVTVGVLGNEEPIALPVVEIVSAKELYDYEAKYTQGLSEHIIPARIPKTMAKRLQRLSVKAHQAIGCRGFSRVDFIIENGRPYVLEINTIPGLTELSLFPDAAKTAGMPFADVVERIVCLALRNC